MSDRIEPYDPGGISKQAAAPAVAVAGEDAIRTLHLGPLDPLVPKEAALAEAGAPLQIGQARSVDDTATPEATSDWLVWHRTAHGTQVAAVRFVSEGAAGVRLGVRVEELPQGAVLRAYGSPSKEVVEISAGQLRTQAELHARSGVQDSVARTWWSPDFGGAQTTLEVEIPQGADPGRVRLAIPRVSHFTQTPQQAQEALQNKAAGECNVDLACRPEYLDQGRSVARMVYVGEDGRAYVCTGTLMNDTSSSGTPYFLSANHCVDSQVVASTLTTDWFYRASSCGGPVTAPVRLTGGATLLYATNRTDTAFMRLNAAPPPGAVYAGSYFGTPLQPGVALAAVHHPDGDVQKVSLGALTRYSVCEGSYCRSSSVEDATYLALNWNSGVVEGGSSGSAAFVTLGQNRYVVGQLLGGTSRCSVPTGTDYYGRFDLSYRAAIQRWLRPDG